MTKTITLTYETEVVDLTDEEIDEMVYQAIDLGFGHCADLINMEIELAWKTNTYRPKFWRD